MSAAERDWQVLEHESKELRVAKRSGLFCQLAELDVTADDVGAGSALVEVLSNLAPVQDRKGHIYEDLDEGIPAIVKALRHEGVLD